AEDAQLLPDASFLAEISEKGGGVHLVEARPVPVVVAWDEGDVPAAFQVPAEQPLKGDELLVDQLGMLPQVSGDRQDVSAGLVGHSGDLAKSAQDLALKVGLDVQVRGVDRDDGFH